MNRYLFVVIFRMRLLVSVLFLFAPLLCLAQGDTTDVPDTVAFGAAAEDSPSQGFVMHKSPTLALLCGLVPGGGQLYTEQYWKIPLFAVPVGTLVGVGIYNHNRYKDYDAQVKALNADTGNANSVALSIAKQNRELYRDRRDLSYGVGGVIFLLSLVDAYVGAHLYDFDVGDTLSSIYIFPDAEHNGIGLGVRW